MEEGQVLLSVDTPQMNSFHSGGRGETEAWSAEEPEPSKPPSRPVLGMLHSLACGQIHCASVSSVELLGFLTLRVPEDRRSI